MENKFWKPSMVHVTSAFKNGKTILEDAYYTPPYKIMNPFYMHQDFMTVLCMSSAAGIMAGDQQEFRFEVKEHSKLEFISQSYEKIHKMDEGFATRITEAHVAPNAYFYYNPLPTQPFKDSAFKSVVNIHLADETSRFVMKEILTAGRYSRGETFDYRFYHNLVNIYSNDTLLYRDNTRFCPNEMDLSGLGMHEDHTHLATLLLVHCDKDQSFVRSARELIDNDLEVDGGLTLLDDGSVVIRILGNRAEPLEKLLDQIMAL